MVCWSKEYIYIAALRPWSDVRIKKQQCNNNNNWTSVVCVCVCTLMRMLCELHRNQELQMLRALNLTHSPCKLLMGFSFLWNAQIAYGSTGGKTVRVEVCIFYSRCRIARGLIETSWCFMCVNSGWVRINVNASITCIVCTNMLNDGD